MPKARPPKGHVLYSLGNLIQARRVQRGLTQRQLAALCGVGHTTVQYWEQGLHDPGMLQLKRIAAFCDLPLSVFLGPLDNVEVPLERAPDGRAAWRKQRAEGNVVDLHERAETGVCEKPVA